MKVAPRAGAWIETLLVNWFDWSKKSHPVRVRGLKQIIAAFPGKLLRRTPCGCVD